jgi:peptidoglycan-associated lipoprotein
MTSALKLASFALLATFAFAGCAKKKPYDVGMPDSGLTGNDTDLTNPSDVDTGTPPQRGNFNPQSDVNYNAVRAATGNSGVIYFETGSSVIRAGERAKLEKVAAWLKENAGKEILASGNCDERESQEYNRNLGEQRANAVRDYLAGLGVAGSRLYTYSYGEDNPADPGHTEAAYAKNRRVEIGVVARQ